VTPLPPSKPDYQDRAGFPVPWWFFVPLIAGWLFCLWALAVILL
jgi:hypothetical protein